MWMIISYIDILVTNLYSFYLQIYNVYDKMIILKD